MMKSLYSVYMYVIINAIYMYMTVHQCMYSTCAVFPPRLYMYFTVVF